MGLFVCKIYKSSNVTKALLFSSVKMFLVQTKLYLFEHFQEKKLFVILHIGVLNKTFSINIHVNVRVIVFNLFNKKPS